MHKKRPKHKGIKSALLAAQPIGQAAVCLQAEVSDSWDERNQRSEVGHQRSDVTDSWDETSLRQGYSESLREQAARQAEVRGRPSVIRLIRAIRG
jgi:hypothetical protein